MDQPTLSPPAASQSSGSPANNPDAQKRPRFTRSSKACRRCRRLRVKCHHDNQRFPCERCRKGDFECIYPARGETSEYDRSFRASKPSQTTDEREALLAASPERLPAIAGNAASSPADRRELQDGPPSLSDEDRPDLLPPLDEVIEGVQAFTTSYFQLGFIPPIIFIERLRKDPDAISNFLLLGILSVSARFTPSLVRRYGGGYRATELFLDGAAALVPDHIYKPSIPAIQGFFLMSIAEWGKEDKQRSSIHMGIAVRMGSILRLHREETYNLHRDMNVEKVMDAEVARRTFWMLENHENIHSGFGSLPPFPPSEVTTLLPCDERDFSFGIQPPERAALMDSPPATANPELVSSPSRSLFATLIQAHNLWGQVSRIASVSSWRDACVSQNDYEHLASMLGSWEGRLPRRHRWSIWNLRGFKAERLDLAYLSVVMVVRLSNVILRRGYLHDIFSGRSQTPIEPGDHRYVLLHDLYLNIVVLQEQIDAFFELRAPDQGYPALIAFCVYISGFFASYLFRTPELCPDIAPQAEQILRRSMRVLVNLQHAWPLAKRWSTALNQAYRQSLAIVQASPGTTLEHDLRPGANTGDATGQSMVGVVGPVMDENEEFPVGAILEGFDVYEWEDVVPFLDMYNNLDVED